MYHVDGECEAYICRWLHCVCACMCLIVETCFLWYHSTQLGLISLLAPSYPIKQPPLFPSFRPSPSTIAAHQPTSPYPLPSNLLFVSGFSSSTSSSSSYCSSISCSCSCSSTSCSSSSSSSSTYSCSPTSFTCFVSSCPPATSCLKVYQVFYRSRGLSSLCSISLHQQWDER